MRLIDANEALDAIDNRIRQIGYEDFVLMLSIQQAVRDVKPVDAVEVVRCKDCKHSIEQTGFAPFIYLCRWDEHHYKETHFCGYGERREHETDRR